MLCGAVLLLTVAASAFLVLTDNASPDHLLTVLGIVTGVAIVVFQLGEQQRASLDLQRENARQDLKLRVYEHLNAKAIAAQKMNRDVRWYAHSIVCQLQLYVEGNERGLHPWNVDKRATDLLERFSKSGDAFVALMVEIERWEISFVSADLFRIALTSASYDIEKAFHPFLATAVKLLPANRVHTELGAYPQPSVSRDDLNELMCLAEPYLQACDEFADYVHDLIVQAQNELLFTLFERRVPIREPLDPRHKVIMEAKRSELLEYFQNETPSGRAYAEA